jgi:hypothetical protein
MKNLKLLSFLLAVLLLWSCSQEIAELTPPTPSPAPTGTPGTADLTKFVAIGNSLTAGFQSGALFTQGQNESLAKIMHQQFVYAGGGTTFNQPDINSVNGYNSSASNPSEGIIRGRFVLFTNPTTGAVGPVAAGTQGVPAPYNTADLPGAYTGNKAALNNFGVPGILLGQCLTPLTGGPPTGNPAYNGLYARFASNPGTSTIIGDAVAANPTFFMFFLGNNDILGYATTGGSGAIPMTSVENFTTQYNGAIATLLGNLPTAKGVVGNIPDVTAIPFFFTVRWNPIPLDAATATQLTGALANPYNGFLAAMVGNGIITQAEADKRRLTFSASLNNPITIVDETLTDLTPYMQGEAAALLPYARARQTKNTDLVTLSAGAVLGTLVSNNPQLINGVTVPMGDQFILIPEEIQEIKDRTAAFNAIISAAVAGSNNRLALADVNSVFNQFVANPQSFIPQTGILLLPTISPPFAAFSEDGVHPNGRGSAFLANVFIDAINAKFGATIPKADVTKYSGTRTPLTINSTY